MPPLPKRVEVLSDDEDSAPEACGDSSDEGPDGPGNLRNVDAAKALTSLMASLKEPCPCWRSKRQRAKVGHTSSNCTTVFLEPALRQQTAHHRLAWLNLHKLDQDRLLFGVLQGMHVAAGLVVGSAASCAKWQYTFLGKPVCVVAFRKLWGVGKTRFGTLRHAVLAGSTTPPMDLRYLSKKQQRPSHIRSWVHTYLEELYQSEAETLPECLDDADMQWWGDVLEEGEFYNPLVTLPGEDAHRPSQVASLETRWLPPGTIYDYWLSYNTLYHESKCSFRHFWKTWRDDWSNKLRFRGRQQHALCSTCVSHKLLIKQLSNDLLKRNRQVQLYEEHDNAQYMDRRVYWSVRAEAMLVPLTVCIILDGMDQGKFCCPRSEIMKSKSLEPLQRPRLHVNAAICHGRTLLVSVSPADFPKNTDVTIELVAACLTMLAHEGLVLARAHLHLQLDNTSSSNKNNHMFRFLSMLTSTNTVRSADCMFLRKGHTHEEFNT